MGLRRGQVAVADLPTARTVKDVRALRACACCGKLGNYPRMVRAVLLNGLVGRSRPYEVGEYLHGRCVIKIGGVALLARLPRREVFGLTLGDIGVDAMKQLLRTRRA